MDVQYCTLYSEYRSERLDARTDRVVTGRSVIGYSGTQSDI